MINPWLTTSPAMASDSSSDARALHTPCSLGNWCGLHLCSGCLPTSQDHPCTGFLTVSHGESEATRSNNVASLCASVSRNSTPGKSSDVHQIGIRVFWIEADVKKEVDMLNTKALHVSLVSNAWSYICNGSVINFIVTTPEPILLIPVHT